MVFNTVGILESISKDTEGPPCIQKSDYFSLSLILHPGLTHSNLFPELLPSFFMVA
jgi:hypothetical protein